MNKINESIFKETTYDKICNVLIIKYYYTKKNYVLHFNLNTIYICNP